MYNHELVNFLNDAAPIMQKYDKRVNAVSKMVGNLSDYEAATLAVLLDNTERQLDKYKRAKNLSDMTYSESVGPFKKHAMDIVSAVYTTFDLKDIISVQPLSQKQGALYYLSYKYANTKGNISAGSKFFAPDASPTRTGHYSGQLVKEETISLTYSAPSTIATLAYFPVFTPASISIVIVGGTGAGTYTYLSTIAGVYHLQKDAGGVSVGTITPATGALAITGDITTGITSSLATYEWNSQKYSTSVPIPRITIAVEEEIVVSKRRQLLFDIMLDASYDYQNQFGRDIDAEIDASIIKEIQNEVAYSVLEEMYSSATGNQGVTYTYNKYPATEISIDDQFQQFLKVLAAMSMKIFTNLGRGKGNYIVAGDDLIAYLDIISDKFYKPYPQDDIRGPYKHGRLSNKYEVFHNPAMGAGTFMMGYKGKDWWEAPYYLGVYLPLMSSKFMMFPDFHGEQGFISMDAQKYIFPLHVVTGTITDSAPSS